MFDQFEECESKNPCGGEYELCQSVTFSMDYPRLQRLGLRGPFTEERNLCSSASASVLPHPAYISPFPPISLVQDPAVLQINEFASSNGVKIPPAGNIGVDASGHLPHQRPNLVMLNNQFNRPADMMTAAFLGDPFQFSGDGALLGQWKQMCSLSSEDVLNDAMPQLISDSMVQQPCLYTCSRDCPHDADSCGSSEIGRPSSDRSSLVGSPSDEMSCSWRISDFLKENLGCPTAGFPPDVHTNHSPSVAAQPDTVDSSRHALSSLSSMPSLARDGMPLEPVSWMPPCTTESGNCSTITTLFNLDDINVDPFSVSLVTHSNGAPPYKRQRALTTEEYSSARPFTIPVIPSLSMISSNFTDALHTDFHVFNEHVVPERNSTVFDPVRGSAARSNQLDNDVKSSRKQNATSIEPQSVAARHRRRKISERVRALEKLIPGGNKMDTASMLDESIEYVKFLQLQVQILEKLGDMCDGSSVTSSPSLPHENIGGGKDGLDTLSSLGSNTSQTCKTVQQLVRPAASPLILSEILQQELFKRKLCLVSLSQCPPIKCARSDSSNINA